MKNCIQQGPSHPKPGNHAPSSRRLRKLSGALGPETPKAKLQIQTGSLKPRNKMALTLQCKPGIPKERHSLPLETKSLTSNLKLCAKAPSKAAEPSRPFFLYSPVLIGKAPISQKLSKNLAYNEETVIILQNYKKPRNPIPTVTALSEETL